jgi:hypothetical protein
VPRCDEDCGDGWDNDRDSLFDCNDPDCADVPPCAEDCSTVGDEDGNGLADCNDPACEACPEECDVLGDEDGNGLSDCDDPACADTEVCCDVDGDGDYADTAYCSFGGDCDDEDPDRGPSQSELVADGIDQDCDGADDCYLDADFDGYGAVPAVVVGGDDLDCTNLPGESNNATDCNDAANSVYPNAPEVPADGIDQDCDAVDMCYRDDDGDGFGTTELVPGTSVLCEATGRVGNDDDCDDASAFAFEVNPDADEVCNGWDDDCDGQIDDADDTLRDPPTWYEDIDGDTFGGTVRTVQSCIQPADHTAQGNDCDDVGPDAILTFPGAAEVVGDAVDQDCDGADDCYEDLDGDGYGTAEVVVDDDLDCDNGGPKASLADDCDDTSAIAADINPSALEVCDDIDNDCDLDIDEADDDLFGAPTWYLDGDQDGFAGATTFVVRCEQPSNHYPTSTDCDDTLSAVNPDAEEVCNGRDDDCDGLIDADDALADAFLVYVDDDGDGFGDGDQSDEINVCEVPDGYSDLEGDCDDGDADINPDAEEIPYDNVDQDCLDGDLVDVDGDGFAGGPGGVDCVDHNDSIFPSAVELADGVDQDCDQVVDEGTERYDDDGDGYAELGGDCDDANDEVSPGVREAPDCNGVDDDCDGVVDEGTDCVDDDGDGQTELEGDCNDGDATVYTGAPMVPGSGVLTDCAGTLTSADLDGDGWTAAAGDCNDADPDVSPGAMEIQNGIDDDCDTLTDEGTLAFDDDGDSFSEAVGDCDDSDSTVNPAASEIAANGRDDDCDGIIDEGGPSSDDDADGFSETEGDCDDADEDVFPYAVEIGNGVDDDCDGLIDEDTQDVDQDGWTVEEGDCNDDFGWANPGAEEICDGVDNDCDDEVDEGCVGREDTDEAPPEDSGCSVVPGSSGWVWLMALAASTRRRRAAVSAA